MTDRLYIGADLGTSSLKLLLVNVNGEILNVISKSYELYFPHSGWSEQSPQHWWTAFAEGIRELVANVDKNSICGIGLAGQMHGLVILDEDDNIIRNAILWNDGRTNKETDYLNSIANLSEYTSNMAFAGFTAPKILWLKENEPENYNKISKIMLPKDYINYLLTGIHCTDYSDASGMLLLDVKNKCWSKEMLDICGISVDKMPKLFESYEVVGTIKPDIADILGLTHKVKVVAGAGDNAGAAIGNTTVSDGKCNISLGTSGTVFVSSNEYPRLPNKAIHTFCHADGGWHIMGCILSAAVCNKWFCSNILKSDDYTAEQMSVTDDMLGNNNVYFLPYLMGERSPVNDTDARGTFIGMNLDTKRNDMLLAVLEGVAFAIRDNIEIVKEAGIHIEKSGLCGGGAKSPLWRKILSNVLNITLELPEAEEGPGFGAALLAMVGNKEFVTVDECSAMFKKIACVIEPDTDIAKRYEAQYNKFKAIYPTIKDVYNIIK